MNLTIQIVPQYQIDRLLEKQWRARLALRQNPFAYAMNVKLKRFLDLRKSGRDVSNIIPLIADRLPAK